MILKNFIVFEGIDGAGTTTQLNLLKQNETTKNFYFTAEPTPSPVGKFLRQMLKGDVKFSNETSAYVFAADRNEHINGNLVTEDNFLITGIKEACKNNFVISDRYLFSSLAYQSVGNDGKLARNLNKFFPNPQLLFYFDIEPEVSLKRVDSRGEREIFEKVDFLKDTVTEYKKAIKEAELNEPEMKVVYIDATASKEEIHKIILSEIEKLIANNR